MLICSLHARPLVAPQLRGAHVFSDPSHASFTTSIFSGDPHDGTVVDRRRPGLAERTIAHVAGASRPSSLAPALQPADCRHLVVRAVIALSLCCAAGAIEPCRALEALTDYKSDRERLCDRSASDDAIEGLPLKQDRAHHDLQARPSR